MEQKIFTVPLRFDGREYVLDARIGNEPIAFVIDTGSNYSIVGLNFMQKQLHLLSKMIPSSPNSSLGYLDSVEVILDGGNRTLAVTLEVLTEVHSPVLGLDFLQTFRCFMVTEPKYPSLTVQPRVQVCPQHALEGVFKQCTVGKTGQLVWAMLDTGATMTLISKRLAKKSGLKIVKIPPVSLTNFHGRTTWQNQAALCDNLCIDGVTFRRAFLIHDQPEVWMDLLIGVDIMKGMSLDFESAELVMSSTSDSCVHVSSSSPQSPLPSPFTPIQPHDFDGFQNDDESSGLAKIKRKITQFGRLMKEQFV